MNKTVSINLGGFFFYIDEDAYQKLSRYFEAIKRSLSPDGREEIMNDIESRISELFSDKITNEKEVIGLKDVDDVIAIMGQPEDYKIEEEEPKKTNFSYSSTTGSKKLYRDTENGMLGGVASGLGYYFGIEKVWIRIALILLVTGFGTGALAYIILWIVIPEAKTTAEKLEMRGEPINISNIEKKIKEEFENVSEKFKNTDYAKMGNQVKSSAEKIGGTLSDVLPRLFGAFGKILGAFIVLFTASILVSLIISLFTVGTFSMFGMPGQEMVEAVLYSGMPLWFLVTLVILAIGIPFFFLLILGLKLLIPNLRSIGSTAKYILLALWIISVIAMITFGVKQGLEYSQKEKISEKKELFYDKLDTLKIRFKYNDLYAKSFDENDDFEFVKDQSNKDMIYSNNVRMEIMPTSEKTAYILVEKTARGLSSNQARNRASKIQYNYSTNGNEIILDNYLLTSSDNKYRNQEVKIYLYLPEGTIFKADSSVQNYDNSDNSYFNLHFSNDNYVYKVRKNKVKCLNCPDNEDEYDDLEEDEDDNEDEDEDNDFNIDVDIDEDEDDDDKRTNIIINKNGVSIKKDTVISGSKKIKELKINKDGIIIKTN
jgi:phage shock protein PspC (stress-responsive transcriptional regulator)